MSERPHLKPPEITNISEANAAIQELAIHRAHIRFLLEHLDLLDADPKVVIEKLVEELPDKPTVITREEKEGFEKSLYLIDGSQSAIDQGEISHLESYLIHLVGRTSPESLHVDSVTETRGDNFSKMDSIQILRDQVRTKRFLEGITAAVDKISTRHTDTIYVCDAGSGALPILGIYAALQSERVECVCIENNPDAIEMANTLINALNLQDRVTVIQADASTYEPEKQIDLLVSETMDAGLLNEPMGDILHHLAGYTKPDAEMLPKQVVTYVGVVSAEEYLDADEFTLIDKDARPLLNIKWQETSKYLAGERPVVIDADIELPKVTDDLLVLVSSEVTVIEGVKLSFDESRLTIPIPVNIDKQMNITQMPDGASSAHIHYVSGDHPFSVEIN